jgi:hypothetical protein
MFSFRENINIRSLFYSLSFSHSLFFPHISLSLILSFSHSHSLFLSFSLQFFKIMATIIWTFEMTQELIVLRARFNAEFENSANRDHIDIWSTIAVRISLNSQTLVTARQCQIKWRSLRRGYDNICRILSDNREGYPTFSPNLFDIEFFDMMRQEFWTPQSNNLI